MSTIAATSPLSAGPQMQKAVKRLKEAMGNWNEPAPEPTVGETLNFQPPSNTQQHHKDSVLELEAQEQAAWDEYQTFLSEEEQAWDEYEEPAKRLAIEEQAAWNDYLNWQKQEWAALLETYKTQNTALNVETAIDEAIKQHSIKNTDSITKNNALMHSDFLEYLADLERPLTADFSKHLEELEEKYAPKKPEWDLDYPEDRSVSESKLDLPPADFDIGEDPDEEKLSAVAVGVGTDKFSFSCFIVPVLGGAVAGMSTRMLLAGATGGMSFGVAAAAGAVSAIVLSGIKGMTNGNGIKNQIREDAISSLKLGQRIGIVGDGEKFNSLEDMSLSRAIALRSMTGAALGMFGFGVADLALTGGEAFTATDTTVDAPTSPGYNPDYLIQPGDTIVTNNEQLARHIQSVYMNPAKPFDFQEISLIKAEIMEHNGIEALTKTDLSGAANAANTILPESWEFKDTQIDWSKEVTLPTTADITDILADRMEPDAFNELMQKMSTDLSQAAPKKISPTSLSSGAEGERVIYASAKNDLLLGSDHHTSAIDIADGSNSTTEYFVKKGGNIWDIVETKYSNQISSLPCAERTAAIQSLCEEIRGLNGLDENFTVKPGQKIGLPVHNSLVGLSSPEMNWDAIDAKTIANGGKIEGLSGEFSCQQSELTKNTGLQGGEATTEKTSSKPPKPNFWA